MEEKTTIDRDLTAMGYRKMKSNLYAKPVACNLFTFDVDTYQWKNLFKGVDGEIHIWDSTKFGSSDDLLSCLKFTEAYTKLFSLPSEFHFYNIEDLFEL